MTSTSDRLIRIARQHAETSRLLGVDFLPLRSGPDATAAASQAATHPAEPAEPQIMHGRGDPGESKPHEPATAKSMASEPKQASHGQRGGQGGTAPAAPQDKAAALADLAMRHDAHCPHCTVVTYHKRTVFGEGDPSAKLMFIGEAPGEEEDRTGRPFVGRAGQKLDEIIKAMGLKRQEVYIANVLKSRPPDNRTPMPHEVEACAPFLTHQIRIIQPKAIVALGGPAAKWLLQTDTGITKLRGQWGTYRDGDLAIPLMPTFHPAYLLRNYTMETRKQVWSDMQKVVKLLADDEK